VLGDKSSSVVFSLFGYLSSAQVAGKSAGQSASVATQFAHLHPIGVVGIFAEQTPSR
jgi:hypothetical protein